MDYQKLASDHGFRYIKYGYGIRRATFYHHPCPFFICRCISWWLYLRQVGAKNIKGRVYTSATGLSLIVPALLLMVYGNNIVFIVAGAILFGLGFGMYDTNNMPILCQFIPSRYRATGYGLMNFVGIAAGAIITNELGKAFEANYKDLVFLIMIFSVCLSIFLQLKVLNPKTTDMTDELMAESKNK